MQPRRAMPNKFSTWYSQRITSRRSDAAKRRGVPPANACGNAARPDRLVSVHDAVRDEARSSRFRSGRQGSDLVGRCHKAWSPIKRSGRRSGKLCPRSPSTSWLSCGEALSILTARRETVIISKSGDFSARAASGRPDREAPFLPR